MIVTVLGALGPGAATAAPDATISPGALMLTPVDGRTANACTAAFVFAGGDTTYLGYAAHCAGTGNAMGLSGCEEETLPLGTDVVIEGRGGQPGRGRLAYSSWATMQARGETDATLCLFNDFALVAVDPSDVGRVDPSVPELGGPTGLDTDGTRSGEPVFSFQPNNGGTTVKAGTSLGDTDRGLTHHVVTDPPGNPGDSGSGYLDGDGTAFGVLSTQFVDRRHTNGVSDLALALAYANRYGALGQVTLVPGAEAFTPPR